MSKLITCVKNIIRLVNKSVRMLDTDAIERMIHKGGLDCAYDDDVVQAREQLDALVKNQIPGRCEYCAYGKKSDQRKMKMCRKNAIGVYVNFDDYCSYFTKREA